MGNYDILIENAKRAKTFSYAPYSKFHVGAALLGKNGVVYTGCNVENAAFGPSNCAERTALFKAVSEGCREFSAIAVISDSPDCVSPCGVCRQALAEFCGPDLTVLMCRADGTCRETTLGSLLPESFGASDLAGAGEENPVSGNQT